MWLAESLSGLGIVYKDTHRFVDAGRHCHQALALAAALGPDDPDQRTCSITSRGWTTPNTDLSRVNRMHAGL
jgi:hypothetical protein